MMTTGNMPKMAFSDRKKSKKSKNRKEEAEGLEKEFLKRLDQKRKRSTFGRDKPKRSRNK